MEQDATVDPIIPGAALVTLSESDEEPDDDFDENEEAEDDDATRLRSSRASLARPVHLPTLETLSAQSPACRRRPPPTRRNGA